MYELWQTEWCPASRRVRQRLTELGIDYLTRQVPVDKDDRILLRRRTGVDSIPVLVDAGMLGRRKDGTHVYYRIADEGVFALCEQVCGSLQTQLATLNALVAGATT